MNVILSIKPMYAEAILNGKKKIEFRKRVFGEKNIRYIYIYSSSPVKKILGYFTYKEIVKKSINEMWRNYKDIANISKDDFFNYFKDSAEGYGIIIGSKKRLKEPIDPYSIIDNFNAPQSFVYIDYDLH